MTYWTSWIGYILIIASIKEFLNILKIKPFPYGALAGFAVTMGIAYYLIKIGIKKQKQNKGDGLL